MWPALKKFIHALFLDETAFLRMARATLMVLATQGMDYAHQNAAILGVWSGRIVTLSTGAMGLSLLLGAGDKTPEAVKELVRQNTPPNGTPGLGG